MSFLFAVKELEVNEDAQRGGIPPRAEYGHWMPPIYAAGYFRPDLPRVYRWKNGVISATDADYEAVIPSLASYRTTTVFYCDQLLNFQAAVCDPSMENMATAEEPYHRWYRLTFENEAGVSRVDVAGSELYLPRAGPRWAHQLGLDPYCDSSSDASALRGLAGDLAIIIALIAFSCRPGELDQILVHDRAWHHYSWRGHHRHHGSKQSKHTYKLRVLNIP